AQERTRRHSPAPSLHRRRMVLRAAAGIIARAAGFGPRCGIARLRVRAIAQLRFHRRLVFLDLSHGEKRHMVFSDLHRTGLAARTLPGLMWLAKPYQGNPPPRSILNFTCPGNTGAFARSSS